MYANSTEVYLIIHLDAGTESPSYCNVQAVHKLAWQQPLATHRIQGRIPSVALAYRSDLASHCPLWEGVTDRLTSFVNKAVTAFASTCDKVERRSNCYLTPSPPFSPRTDLKDGVLLQPIQFASPSTTSCKISCRLAAPS